MRLVPTRGEGGRGRLPFLRSHPGECEGVADLSPGACALLFPRPHHRAVGGARDHPVCRLSGMGAAAQTGAGEFFRRLTARCGTSG